MPYIYFDLSLFTMEEDHAYTEKEISNIVKMQRLIRKKLQTNCDNKHSDKGGCRQKPGSRSLSKKWKNKVLEILELEMTLNNIPSYNKLMRLLIKRYKKLKKEKGSLFMQYKQLKNLLRVLSKVTKQLSSAPDEFSNSIDITLAEKCFPETLEQKISTQLVIICSRILIVYLTDNDAHVMFPIFFPNSNFDQCISEKACSCKRSICFQISKYSLVSSVENCMDFFFAVHNERNSQ